MGAYAYCGGCNAMMSAPNIREVLRRRQTCGYCDKEREMYDWEIDGVIDEFVERVEALEKEKELRDVLG